MTGKPRGTYAVGRVRREPILDVQAVNELTELFRRSAEAGFLREDVDYEHLDRDCIAVNDGMQLQWVLAGGRLDLVARIKENLERIAAPVQRVPRPIDLSAAPAPAVL